MSSLPPDTIARANRVLSQLVVPPDHADPVAYYRAELRKAGFSTEEVNRIYFMPRAVEPNRSNPVAPDLSSEEIVALAQRSLYPWRKVLLAVMAKADAAAEDHGDVAAFAVALENEELRKSVLMELGQVIADVLDQMRFRVVTKPEQAILCILSASREHNRQWVGSMSRRNLEKVERLLFQSPALGLLFSMWRTTHMESAKMN